ncbi:carbohydrate kinase family protein [Streptomyces meridianus]|uniref:Carbohydrate kinase n=1 Tax=Streptomyces meridianus TaxID=2938945 RepID=A0ABT0XC05_9ACTN|nr:carbohydrate kinase [Streptomyces meridianus]MCM2580059.1 carbohydrate kinase [Streptomyces meridianus]
MNGGSRVTVVGESLVDLIWRRGAGHVVPVPGGSPANVAVGLHRLGRPATLVTVWGDDPPGELVRAHLEGSGVDVCRAPSEAGRTTLALAYLDDAGAATYDFLTAWDPRELPVPADTAVLHTGSLAAVVEPGASRVLELCREFRSTPGRTVVTDLNVRPAVQPDRAAYRQACLRLAGVSDVVKASDEDLSLLFAGLAPADAGRLLLAEGPRLVVVTLGADGALAVTAGAQVRVPAPRTTVVDTIGAGDTFQASLLDAVAARGVPSSPEGLREVLTRCTVAAAVNCSRTGANPPTLAELEQAVADRAG